MAEDVARPGSDVGRAEFGSATHAGRGDISQAGRDFIQNLYGRSSDPLPVPRQLPSHARDFVGRADQIAGLSMLLRTDGDFAVKAVAIVGTAGVGKTALALRWAHDSRQTYPDGDLYVNLRGYDAESPVDPSEVLDGFLRAFDIPPEKIPANQSGREGVYRALLARRRVLVVLDNAAAAGQVRPLLPGWGLSDVLITSRSRLAGLSVRDGVTTINLDVLPAEDATALLVKLIGRRAAVDATETAELARVCAYLPLALRIVAERARMQPHLPVADIVTELHSSTDRLSLLAVGDEDDLASVRGVFSWSYKSLRPASAEMFCLLGLHPGPDISAVAAAALAGADPTETRRRLDALLSAHLVDPVGRDRYQPHDLLRAYATECAARDLPPDKRRAAVRRELLWYLQAVNHADELLAPQRRHVPADVVDTLWAPPRFTSPAEAVRWCEAERVNCVAMVRRAAEEGHHDIAWKLPLALNTFFYLRWYLADWAETAGIGVASARTVEDPFATAWSLTGLGGAHEEASKWTAALKYYEEALTLWRISGDLWGETIGRINVGNAYRALGRLDDSVAFGHAALGLARQVGNSRLVGTTLQLLGQTYRTIGNLDEASACFQRALESHREAKDEHSQGQVLSHLADLYRDRGQEAEALSRYGEALEVQRSIGDRRGEGHTLLGLGKAELAAGRIAEARAALHAARELFVVLNEMLLRDEVDEQLRIAEQ